MNDLAQTNENRSMMTSTYGDGKLDKSKELNASMSITKTEQDEYEKKIHNLGGRN